PADLTPAAADDGQQFRAGAADLLRGGVPTEKFVEQFLDARFVGHGRLSRGRDRGRTMPAETAQDGPDVDGPDVDGSDGGAPGPRPPSLSVRSRRPRSSRRCTVLGTTPKSSAASV